MSLQSQLRKFIMMKTKMTHLILSVAMTQFHKLQHLKATAVDCLPVPWRSSLGGLSLSLSSVSQETKMNVICWFAFLLEVRLSFQAFTDGWLAGLDSSQTGLRSPFPWLLSGGDFQFNTRLHTIHLTKALPSSNQEPRVKAFAHFDSLNSSYATFGKSSLLLKNECNQLRPSKIICPF